MRPFFLSVALIAVLLGSALYGAHSRVIAQSQPSLTISSVAHASYGDTVTIDVDFTTSATNNIAAIIFSIDYDATCLSYQSRTFSGDIPASYLTSLTTDFTDPDGELDIFIADLSGSTPLPTANNLLRLRFLVTCEPAVGQQVDATVQFSTDPAVDFG
ncbi:MAG TPA: cohesin domain-containing protein, partial [Caldilineaceae bacterium]|nr:cohesin domain-containing protein [Caldilineaceae bacterium]